MMYCILECKLQVELEPQEMLEFWVRKKNAQKRRDQTNEVSFDGWIDKENVVHIYIHAHNRIFSAIKMKEILPFETTWLDFEGIS